MTIFSKAARLLTVNYIFSIVQEVIKHLFQFQGQPLNTQLAVTTPTFSKDHVCSAPPEFAEFHPISHQVRY